MTIKYTPGLNQVFDADVSVQFSLTERKRRKHSRSIHNPSKIVKDEYRNDSEFFLNLLLWNIKNK